MGCAYTLVPNKHRKAALVKYPGCRSLDELGSVLDINN